MAGRTEKGKIKRNEWPSIVARYRGGESFAGIARSLGCTPPAIRYIVGRHEKSGQPPETPGKHNPLPLGRNGGASNGSMNSVDPARSARSTRELDQPVHNRIDENLRARVNSDIASFLVAFDAAFGDDSIDNCKVLLDATDRLLRAGARTRIALESLEDGKEKTGRRSNQLSK